MTLVTHQAFFRDTIDFLLIMPPQEPYEIDRGILKVLLLDIHRACVKAQATARASVDFRLSDTFPWMIWLDSGVAQKNPEHLSQDVHVTAERHRREEKSQTDRIGPPTGHEP